jgi:hypothetical protein
MRFLIERVVQDEGVYVYNVHNIVEKHFSISIAHARGRGRSLVYYNHISYIKPIIRQQYKIVKFCLLPDLYSQITRYRTTQIYVLISRTYKRWSFNRIKELSLLDST